MSAPGPLGGTFRSNPGTQGLFPRTLPCCFRAPSRPPPHFLSLSLSLSEAWLALLQMPIPSDIFRKVLLRLHSSVMPNMVNPILLSDFLTYALNQGAAREGA